MAFRFRKLRVYIEAKKFHIKILTLSSRFPREYLYLSDQIRRSSLSIMLNIAEGSSKQTDKDFNRFITISSGSLDETMASLEICLDLKLIKVELFSELEHELENLSNQLGSFSKTLKTVSISASSKKLKVSKASS